MSEVTTEQSEDGAAPEVEAPVVEDPKVLKARANIVKRLVAKFAEWAPIQKQADTLKVQAAKLLMDLRMSYSFNGDADFYGQNTDYRNFVRDTLPRQIAEAAGISEPQARNLLDLARTNILASNRPQALTVASIIEAKATDEEKAALKAAQAEGTATTATTSLGNLIRTNSDAIPDSLKDKVNEVALKAKQAAPFRDRDVADTDKGGNKQAAAVVKAAEKAQKALIEAIAPIEGQAAITVLPALQMLANAFYPLVIDTVGPANQKAKVTSVNDRPEVTAVARRLATQLSAWADYLDGVTGATKAAVLATFAEGDDES